MREVLLGILALLVLPQLAVAQSNLVLELQVNNTINDVHIPGSGESASSGLGGLTLFTTPPHFFIASYAGGLLMGMAGGSGTSLSTEGGSGYHRLGFEQSLGEPVLLAFTQGDWQAIEERVSDIESGDFMDYVSPSFGYGLGTYHPLKVALYYQGIDIDGALRASKGLFKLVIENKGQSGGRPIVNIRDF